MIYEWMLEAAAQRLCSRTFQEMKMGFVQYCACFAAGKTTMVEAGITYQLQVRLSISMCVLLIIA